MSGHINANRFNWFSVLYRTRVKVHKGATPIVNLSLIFTLFAAGSAPWVAVTGLVIALILGYRFSIERDSPDFAGSFGDVVHSASQNVQNAVDSFTNPPEE